MFALCLALKMQQDVPHPSFSWTSQPGGNDKGQSSSDPAEWSPVMRGARAHQERATGQVLLVVLGQKRQQRVAGRVFGKMKEAEGS